MIKKTKAENMLKLSFSLSKHAFSSPTDFKDSTSLLHIDPKSDRNDIVLVFDKFEVIDIFSEKHFL